MAHNATCETLLHEVLHACIAMAGQVLTDDADELAVRVLAPTLLQVLRDNPELVAYLTKK